MLEMAVRFCYAAQNSTEKWYQSVKTRWRAKAYVPFGMTIAQLKSPTCVSELVWDCTRV